MKNILKVLLFSFLLSSVMWSCKKDDNKDFFEGGTPPVLTASTATLNLTFANANNQALLLSWTNPNYKFTTGLSSQDVSYLIEIDTAGANFTNPQKQTVAVSKDLSQSFIVSQFNDYLLNQLVLKPGIPHNLEIRVKSALTNNAVTLISNVIKITATPYAIPPKVAPPTTGQLFIVGSATPGGDAHGWDNPVPVPTQQFTQISSTLYEITIPLIGGKEYLFLPLNGDWGHKYAVPDKTVAGLSDGGDFGFDKSDNFPGPAASGTYKIQVDFQRGKFTVTKQ
jgi:starch-binding outer membrane protein SusE/F